MDLRNLRRFWDQTIRNLTFERGIQGRIQFVCVWEGGGGSEPPFDSKLHFRNIENLYTVSTLINSRLPYS